MRTVLPFFAGLAMIAILAAPAGGRALVSPAEAPLAPPFTRTAAVDWLNSPPLSWAQLKGKVTLVEFWTFDCWNCYRSIPWLQTLEPRFGAHGLRIVGVHTPELPQEYLRDNVVRKVAELGVRYPVMLDNDYAFWNAFGNRYWPAFYLVDAEGRVRASFAGETHAGDGNARAVEGAIETLLAEAPAREKP